MPTLNPDIISAAFKGLPANLLSPLTSALDGEGASAGPFSNLLSEIAAAQTQAPPPPSADTQNTPPISSSSSSSPVPFPDTSALRQVLNYIRAQEKTAQQNNNQSSQNSSSSSANTADASSGASSNTATQNTSTSTQNSSSSNTGDTDASDGSSDTTSNTSTDPSKPPDAHTIALALVELQQLMQWLAQNLSSALPAAGAVSSASAITGALAPTPTTDPTSNTGSTGSNTLPAQGTDPTTDPTQTSSTADGTDNTAAELTDALAAFLALMQVIEVQLITSGNAKAPDANATNPSNAVAASNTATTNTSSNLSSYAQIKAGLEKLEAALEAAITGNAKLDAADATTDTTAATDSSSTSSSSSTTSSSTTTTVKTSAVDDLMAAINPAAPTEAHLFRLFADIFGNAAQAAANTVSNNLAVTAQGTGDAGIGSDQSGNDGSPSSNMAALPDNSSSPLLASGVQASNSLFSFANQLSATHAGTGGAMPSTILDQVLLSLNRGIKSGDSQMTIQLQPGDLGRINVKLDISSDGKVQGTVIADNPHTLDQLLKDVRSLERALQEAGLRADPGSLQFSLGNQQQPGNAFAQQGQGSGATGGSSSDSSSIDSLSANVAALPADSEIYYITPGGVNIKV